MIKLLTLRFDEDGSVIEKFHSALFVDLIAAAICRAVVLSSNLRFFHRRANSALLKGFGCGGM